MTSPAIVADTTLRDPAAPAIEPRAFHRADAEAVHDIAPAGRLDHTVVYDRAGHRMGRVQTVVVDPISGEPAYAVIGQGGWCGIGRSLRPAPWSALAYDARRDAYVAAVDPRSFARAPRPESFMRCADDGYRDAVSRYYAARERPPQAS